MIGKMNPAMFVLFFVFLNRRLTFYSSKARHWVLQKNASLLAQRTSPAKVVGPRRARVTCAKKCIARRHAEKTEQI